MKLLIANQDRSSDIGAGVSAAARRFEADPPRMLAPQHSALALKDARTGREYLDRFVELVSLRHGARTADFEIPRKPGLAGAVMARVRGVLWRLLRYQHDRMSFQQNLVNELLLDAVSFERESRRRELESLKQRVDALESGRAGGGRG
jgi:hypothetical protein